MSGLLNNKTVTAGQTISFTTKDGKTLSGTVKDDGTVVANGNSYSGVHMNWDGSYVTDEKEKPPVVKDIPPAKDDTKIDSTNAQKGAANAIWVLGSSGSGWGSNPDRAKRLAAVFGSNNSV